MGLIDFFNKLVKRENKGTAGVEETETPQRPLSFLEVSEPMACLAAELLFPLSFAVGDAHVRGRVLRLASGPEAFDPAMSGPWYVWKAETPSGKLVGYWQLPPGGASEPCEEAAWQRTAGALASGAAAKLKASLASREALLPAAFAAGPSAPPPLAGKPVFRVDFTYAVRGVFREGRAYASVSLPSLLASAFSRGGSALRDDPIGALIAASHAMALETKGAAWIARAFRFPAVGSARTYLPIYELFNILSDSDLRLVIQNCLVARTRGGKLGAVFLYRQRVQTDKGSKEVLVSPQSFDHRRNDALFPEAVFADRRLDPMHAAQDVDDFLRQNDAVYESLVRAVRTNALSLSPQGALLIREIYEATVYAPKRKKLESMIEAGTPFAELSELPEHIARRAVDSSGGKDLAAAVLGSAEALAFVAKWCSKRKTAELTEELKRLGEGLADASADVDSIVARRGQILEKAERLKEIEREEQGRPRRRP